MGLKEMITVRSKPSKSKGQPEWMTLLGSRRSRYLDVDVEVVLLLDC